MITRVSIKNFKAIRDASVDLTPIHLLIGPNDSGKTSVLEAIAAICRSVDHDAPNSFLGRWEGRELVNSAATEAQVEVGIDLDIDSNASSYKIEATFPASGRDIRWKMATAGTADLNGIPIGDPQRTLRTETEISGARFHRAGHVINVPHVQKTTVISAPVLSAVAALNANSAFEAIKRPEWQIAQQISEAVGGCWYLRWTARNLALPTALNPERRFQLEGNGFGLPTLIDDLLNYDRESFAALEREFTQIFPHVRTIALVQQQGFNSPVDQADETLTLQPSAGKQVVFRLKNTDRDLPASQAAEGMLYILGYLALMYLPQPPRVLLIEEPENGIHPNLVGGIVRILRRLVERHPETQIVMTSHSPYLVDAFQPEEVTWCRRNESGDVVLTRLDTLPEVERSLSVFSLGEIWTGELEPVHSREDAQ